MASRAILIDCWGMSFISLIRSCMHPGCFSFYLFFFLSLGGVLLFLLSFCFNFQFFFVMCFLAKTIVHYFRGFFVVCFS